MNSKNKGNTFERKIANILSERFEPVTKIKSGFRRNPDSGSFFGGSNKTRTESHDTSKASFGDIIAPADFAFSVECKHYKTPPSFAALIKQSIGDFDGWIKQAEQDSQASGKYPCIIVKYNNVAEIVLIKELFGDIQPIARYDGYHIVRLTDFLSQPNWYYFKPVA